MANPTLPCSWVLPDWCGKCAEFEEENQELFENKLAAAIQTVFRLTYSRYTGICEITIKPCKRDKCCGNFNHFSWDAPPSYVTSKGGTIYNSSRPFDCFKDCDCGANDCLKLPYGPVDSITEIRIGGVVLDPANYFLKDRKYVCRSDGETWDTCQDLALPDDEAFTIKYKYGINPPADLIERTMEYACEAAKQCLDEPCALPRAITEREGQLILDPLIYAQKGLTGYAPLDAIIVGMNKHRALRPSKFVNPRKRRKTHTI